MCFAAETDFHVLDEIFTGSETVYNAGSGSGKANIARVSKMLVWEVLT